MLQSDILTIVVATAATTTKHTHSEERETEVVMVPETHLCLHRESTHQILWALLLRWPGSSGMVPAVGTVKVLSFLARYHSSV